LPDRVLTDDHRVHLAPPELLAAAQRLDDALAAELRTVGQLKLITKRALTTHNSWTHNLADFVEGDKGTNHVWMHPDDAQRLGLREDDVADVRSAIATIRLPVKLLDDLMPGVVAVPHGWGHQHARGLSVASRTRGVNVNLLAADGPDGIDRVAGMAHLTGIPVDVYQAAGPLDPTSWSGIAPA
jgi:anaerobic selenocysteine-containing dehydrogenase